MQAYGLLSIPNVPYPHASALQCRLKFQIIHCQFFFWIRPCIPDEEIDRLIPNAFNKIYLPKKIVEIVEKNKLVLSLEYVGKYSLVIDKRVQTNIILQLNVVFSSKKK